VTATKIDGQGCHRPKNGRLRINPVVARQLLSLTSADPEPSMNIRKILCPVDFSDPNQAANEFASVLARSTGAEIVYFHVTLPEAPYGAYGSVDPSEMMAQDLARLKKIRPTVEGVKASWEVDFGPSSKRIVQFAEKHDVDLIVIGTHGRSGLKRVLMGSVAEAVVRKARCPVLAIKPRSQSSEAGEEALSEEQA
jgi:nucleotide-binding universal stress UspA family protein